MGEVDFSYYLFSDGDHNYLWLMVIAVLMYCAILFFQRAKMFKKTGQNSAYRLYLGYGVFLFFNAVTRAFFIMSNYYSVHVSEEVVEFLIWIRLAYISSLFALAFFFNGLEKYILPTKGFATVLPASMGILSMFLPYDTMRMINYVFMPIYFIFAIGGYVYLFKNASGSLKRNTGLSLLGLCLYFLGIFLDSKLFKDLFTEWGMRIFIFIFCPIVTAFGILVFTYYTGKRITD